MGIGERFIIALLITSVLVLGVGFAVYEAYGWQEIEVEVIEYYERAEYRGHVYYYALITVGDGKEKMSITLTPDDYIYYKSNNIKKITVKINNPEYREYQKKLRSG